MMGKMIKTNNINTTFAAFLGMDMVVVIRGEIDEEEVMDTNIRERE